MNRRKNIYKIGLFICIFSLTFNFFSQEQDLEDNLEIEQSEVIDSSLQDNFVILENTTKHILNPHITSTSADSQILSGLYEGLFSYNPVTLDPEYAIAQEYKISRDKKRWTFTLRDNAFFSNGEKITANDVRKSWLKLLSTPNAPYSSLLNIIQGAKEFSEGKISENEVKIKVNSENSLSITLNNPASYLPKLLCHSSFSIVNDDPSVYSGAFCLAEEKETEIILEKNKFYWDKQNTHLKKITFKQSDDPTENTHLFNNGDVDWICGSTNGTILLNQSALAVGGEFGTAYLFFKIHDDDEDSWLNKDFRNALLEAVPWSELRSSFIVKAETFVYPLNDYPAVNGFYYTDEEVALQMMNDARDKYGIPRDEILDVTLEMSSNGYSDDMLNLLVEAWKKLGVNFIIKRTDPYTYFTNAPTSSADMLSYVWIGDFADPLSFLELFKSDSSLNDSGWKNKEFDDLLLQADLASVNDRYSYLSQAENILLDDGMILPIYHPIAINVVDMESVGGWAVNAFDLHPLKYLYRKEVKSKIKNVL